MRESARRICLIGLVGGLLGGMGCNPSPMWPKAQNPGPDCVDPCGAMTCPDGNRCVWNGRCQPRCEPAPTSSSWKP
jgi:hypothetical protein